MVVNRRWGTSSDQLQIGRNQRAMNTLGKHNTTDKRLPAVAADDGLGRLVDFRLAFGTLGSIFVIISLALLLSFGTLLETMSGIWENEDGSYVSHCEVS